MTHRQYLAWQAWLHGDLERVGRQEFYLMQLTMQVRNLLVALGGLGKHPRQISFEDVRLKLRTPVPVTNAPVPVVTPATMLGVQKARWALLLGQKMPLVES